MCSIYELPIYMYPRTRRYPEPAACCSLNSLTARCATAQRGRCVAKVGKVWRVPRARGRTLT